MTGLPIDEHLCNTVSPPQQSNARHFGMTTWDDDYTRDGPQQKYRKITPADGINIRDRVPGEAWRHQLSGRGFRPDSDKAERVRQGVHLNPLVRVCDLHNGEYRPVHPPTEGQRVYTDYMIVPTTSNQQ